MPTEQDLLLDQKRAWNSLYAWMEHVNKLLEDITQRLEALERDRK